MKKIPFFLALFIFILLSIPYLHADLWMDELISYWDFWKLPSISKVMTTYPIANNHIFFSVIMWLWIRFPFVSHGEFILRLPCLFIAIGSALLLFWGIKSIRNNIAAQKSNSSFWGYLGMLLFLFSPVILPFSFQLRGYGLSFFFTILSLWGCLEIFYGKMKKGLFLFLPSILILPGIIPSNILIVTTEIFALFTYQFYKKEWKKNSGAFLLILLFFFCSLVPYFLIFQQFYSVASMDMGWPSSLLCLLNIILGFFCHFLILFLGKYNKKNIIPLILLLLWSFIFIFLAVILRNKSPYPRVFLPFLPFITFIIIIFLKEIKINTILKNKYYLILFICVANFIFWNTFFSFLTLQKIKKGTYPQNIVEQYYAKSQNASKTIGMIAQKNRRHIIICDFHQWLTFRYYWYLYGNNPHNILWYKRGRLEVNKKIQEVVKKIFYNKISNTILFVSSHKKLVERMIKNIFHSFKGQVIFYQGKGIYKIFKIVF